MPVFYIIKVAFVFCGLGVAHNLPTWIPTCILGTGSLILAFSVTSIADDPEPVQRCVLSAFFANAARYHSSGCYRYVCGALSCDILIALSRDCACCLLLEVAYHLLIITTIMEAVNMVKELVLFAFVNFCLVLRSVREDQTLHIHPTSVLYASKPPPW